MTIIIFYKSMTIIFLQLTRNNMIGSEILLINMMNMMTIIIFCMTIIFYKSMTIIFLQLTRNNMIGSEILFLLMLKFQNFNAKIIIAY